MHMKHLTLLATALLCLAACKKEEEEDHTATIQAQFNFVHGSSAFDINDTYSDGAGHVLRFSKLKFYASDFVLTNDAGSTVADFTNKAVLADAASSGTNLVLGTMGHGHIHEARFSLGINSTLNHADPMQAAYPLNQPDMHWFWNPMMGYIFLRAEGLVDSNADGVLEMGVDQAFEYHCASDALLRSKEVHIHRDVDGGTVTLPMKVDVAVLLAGTDFLANGTAHGGPPHAAALMDSLQSSVAAQ